MWIVITCYLVFPAQVHVKHHGYCMDLKNKTAELETELSGF